jgi:hypothetical protein
MGERQLRSRSMATAVEAAPRDSESCHDSRELVCNIEVQIGCEEEQSPDNRLKSLRIQMTILLYFQSS